MDEIKLKPCPFCGGRAILYVWDSERWSVKCEKCNITTSPYGKCALTQEIWNRRAESAENTQLKAEVERMKKERDAVMKDLTNEGGCRCCKYAPQDYSRYPCHECNFQRTNWAWRGIEPPKGETK